VLVIPLYKEFRIETENLGTFTVTDGRSESCSRTEREMGNCERLILIKEINFLNPENSISI